MSPLLPCGFRLQVAHVASSGFDLFVHPSAFLVHMPHPSSKAMSAYMASDKARAAQKARAWEQQQAQEGRRGQEGRVGEGHRRKVGRWQVQGERTRRQGQGVVRGGGQGVRLLQAAGGKATHLGGAGMQAEAVQTAGPGQTVQPEQQRQEQRLDLRGQTGHADLQTDQRREVATGHRVQGQEEQGHTRQQQHQDAADAEPVLQAATSGAPRRLQQQAGRAGAAAGSQPKRPSAAARAFHRRVSELREQVRKKVGDSREGGHPTARRVPQGHQEMLPLSKCLDQGNP